MKMFAIAIALIFLICASANASKDENTEFLNATIEKFKKECKDEKGIDYLNCWSEYSPKKCKGLVYGKDRMTWSRCVYSCGSAGFYSKTFGECSN